MEAVLQEKIETVLNEKVRPILTAHHGNVELAEVKDGVVYLRLLGQCSDCPASYLTMEKLILAELTGEISEVRDVVAIQYVSEELLSQARKILGGHREKS